MPTSTPAVVLCQNERHALAFLGLLSHMYLNWDPPIQASPDAPQATHHRGLNIDALIIDNSDGEVLAIECNRIHSDHSPVQHAEQLAVRSALVRIGQKRARDVSATVEEYCREKLFYAPGKEEEAFAYHGCTLVTSLEPCPMCAATLCVCSMKRVIYVVPDESHGGSWDGRLTGQKGIKEAYYPKYDLRYGQWGPGDGGRLSKGAGRLYGELLGHVQELRGRGVPDTQFFDHLHEDLRAVFAYFGSIGVGDLVTTGADLDRNTKTLADLKRLCSLKL